ncbi:phosphoenolpyruvate--protein phosphotransferase [Paenibacillus ehimensis]|uniref:Phosphoenolpyruvate-protein phosphotransferase n=1 Tax=Paenibacillus ehimensis TaxID=79264 RepID=A0ABT8VFD0_9BACL|nr:phosphoenolpyruvate--protein phosphotransferase [Paenibacillus ehimensis]MDO3679688.1 phosphoenolpyruvate--protein phosphotransferase [Paenibacillus ehimensis]MEC0211527.1 phosphoenolpyruvate--protein phosphotransferase [Paenibacillus ehimensis]
MREQRISGIGVSEGVRIGSALRYSPVPAAGMEPERESIGPDEVTAETARLRQAKEACASELQAMVERTKRTLGEDKAGIIAGQLRFLDDPKFYPAMERKIAELHVAADKAVREVTEFYAARLESMANEYMRERAADIRDIGGRLLSSLRGGTSVRLSDLREPVILVADDLAPSDTVQLDPRVVLAFVTRVGGKTSHTAILARSLGIPAVVGAGDALDAVRDGETLVVDGGAGLCVRNPEAAYLRQAAELQEQERELRDELEAFRFRPAVTADGQRVELAANIGTVPEAEAAAHADADGIGLYRTEFLFMGASRLPDEEEQYAAYRQAAEAMTGRPVIIRTLDIGGDKELPALELPKETNPFLGYRAIRIGLDRPELLRTQLRAILRASAHGSVKIMFPMISSMDEWRKAKGAAHEAMEELRREGVDFDRNVELGIMVEVPSTAVMADSFAREVDFFSIGTNDLVQYTLAVDRMNEKVAELYDYFHPAVLELIRRVIEAARRHGKWAGMCGGMAGDPLAAPLLLGLGLDEWSMETGALPKVKRALAQLNAETCRERAQHWLQLATADEVRRELERFRAQLPG